MQILLIWATSKFNIYSTYRVFRIENIIFINLNNFTLNELTSPVNSGGEPNLFVSSQGEIYLSWVEYINDTTDALMFSKIVNDTWTTPKEIARGSDWFVNWADFPSLVVYKNNKQHYLNNG